MDSSKNGRWTSPFLDNSAGLGLKMYKCLMNWNKLSFICPLLCNCTLSLWASIPSLLLIPIINTFWEMVYIKVFAWQRRRSSDNNISTFFLETDFYKKNSITELTFGSTPVREESLKIRAEVSCIALMEDLRLWLAQIIIDTPISRKCWVGVV